MSLLDKAQATKRKPSQRPINQEDFELAFAWLRDQVSASQVATAYEMKTKSSGTSPAIYRMGLILKEAYRKGFITIVEPKVEDLRKL